MTKIKAIFHHLVGATAIKERGKKKSFRPAAIPKKKIFPTNFKHIGRMKSSRLDLFFTMLPIKLMNFGAFQQFCPCK